MPNTNPPWIFPFGRPVLPRPPSARGRRRSFVLGAYPSALHVEWTSPEGIRIQALPIDNEPTPFWDGDGKGLLFQDWFETVNFGAHNWGWAMLANEKFNGSSGIILNNDCLAPMHIAREDVCITDCLDTYRASVGVFGRLDEYDAFARAHDAPQCSLGAHPNEDAIVREAIQDHSGRLSEELDSARPDQIITLGNAALRVMRTLVQTADDVEIPEQLALANYGHPYHVSCNGRPAMLIPLKHPGQRSAPWSAAHQAWINGLPL